ncbi:hypothetical protein VNI00_015850 [Paramarasmius palmivorus]|uniref:Uncharacterized protein n=1 Tax=Paramarasmius palmivorus TaxID=297713 RepID=A0AAW0BIE1_9AGAR
MEEDTEEQERLDKFREVCSREDEDRDDDLRNDDDLDLIHPDRQEWEHRSKFGTGETRKELSWIWLSGGGIDVEDGADENSNEVLRTEWCKSRARARRAKEEVLLVQEEMRRTLEYLEWRAQQWEACGEETLNREDAEQEGSRAYALAQAELQRALKDAFTVEWKKPLEVVERSEVKALEGIVRDDVNVDGSLDESSSDDGSDSDEEEEDEHSFYDGLDGGTDFEGTDGDESVKEWDPEVDGF